MRTVGFIGLAIAASVALAYSGKTASVGPAVAQSAASYLPTGDVWITADEPMPFQRGTIEAAPSARRDVSTGDVWPASF